MQTPIELEAALNKSRTARGIWDALPPSHRKEYVEWIASAKKEATRKARASKAIGMMTEKQRERR